MWKKYCFFGYNIQGSDKEIFNVYNVVSDLDTKKLYIVPQPSVKNSSYSFILGDFKIVTKKGFSKSKKVEFGDKGTLYIVKEDKNTLEIINNELVLNGRKVIYLNQLEKKKIDITLHEPHKLYNLNPANDVSLFEKATLVNGTAIFDDKE